MSAGDVWFVPSGRRAIELQGSTKAVLRLAVIDETWPFPRPAVEYARVLCTPAPSRYLRETPDDVGEALL